MEKFYSHVSYEKPTIINIAGYGGSHLGYEDKYVKIANVLKEEDIANFLSVDNKFDENDIFHRAAYKKRVLRNLKPILDSARAGKEEIYLMGTSAGASIIPILCEMYPDIITKVLMTAPSENVSLDETLPAIKTFKGEVYIMVGGDDDIVGILPAAQLFSNLWNASKRRLEIINGCDHNFSGERAGKMFSAAVLWAFANDRYPDLLEKNGIKLYD